MREKHFKLVQLESERTGKCSPDPSDLEGKI